MEKRWQRENWSKSKQPIVDFCEPAVQSNATLLSVEKLGQKGGGKVTEVLEGACGREGGGMNGNCAVSQAGKLGTPGGDFRFISVKEKVSRKGVSCGHVPEGALEWKTNFSGKEGEGSVPGGKEGN